VNGKIIKMNMKCLNRIIVETASILMAGIMLLPVFIGIYESVVCVNEGKKVLPLNNYMELLFDTEISVEYNIAFNNSLIVSILTVIITLAVCYFAAYGISMYDFYLKRYVLILLALLIVLPYKILYFSLYKEMVSYSLENTFGAEMLPFVCSPLIVCIFRFYLLKISKELIMAARIDGASEYKICIFFVPMLIKEAFVISALTCFVQAWNRLLWPMLILRSIRKFTLQQYFYYMESYYIMDHKILLAGAVTSCLFIIVLAMKAVSCVINDDSYFLSVIKNEGGANLNEKIGKIVNQK